MDQIEKNLNKDYKYFCACIKRFLKNLKDSTDQQLVRDWLDELSKQRRNTHEAQLRNDFLFYLLKCCEAGTLKEPFICSPPKGNLLNFQNLLPKDSLNETRSSDGLPEQGTDNSNRLPKIVDKSSDMLGDTCPSESTAEKGPDNSIRLPKIFDKSPAKGAFLISQPIPRHGTICYLAVVNRAASK